VLSGQRASLVPGYANGSSGIDDLHVVSPSDFGYYLRHAILPGILQGIL
jgi:hypothetical protein